VRLYTKIRCGFRGVSKILSILQETFKWDFPCTPNRNSIENWVKKCGYHIYKEPSDEMKSEQYAEIVDESLMIGSQKMLLTLGVNADKLTKTPIAHKDVHILKMSVAPSWNGWRIWSDLRETEKDIGHPPEYIISDNANSLGNGIRRAGYIHIRDVSHTLGLIMKHLYEKEKEFISFTQDIQSSKIKSGMLRVGYLIPPKQRTVARFMNLSNYVTWAMKMLRKFSKLNKYEKEAFSFVTQYASLIRELYKSILCINAVQKEIISNGISHHTLESCLPYISKYLKKGTLRMKTLAQEIIQYIQEETNKIKPCKNAWNASSDIIESLFGIYKSRKASNSLYGVTSFVLFLPLYVHLEAKEQSFDFKRCLEKVCLCDIEKWGKDNLGENLVSKRRKSLKFNVNNTRHSLA